MILSEDVLTLLRERFGFTEVPKLGLDVDRERIVALARALKEELGFGFLVYCAAAHYPAKDPDPDRVLVEYRFRRFPLEEIALRVWVPTGETTPSLAGVYAGADWQEREQYDLVGVVFSGHPDLRRIMLPEDWEGHPLRRDYAIDTRHHPWR